MFSIRELPWLPLPPPDFRSQCRGFASSPEPVGNRIGFLAGFRLTGLEASVLGKTIAACRAKNISLAPLSPFRLGVLSNATVDLLAPVLPAAAARHGVALDVVVGPYDQIEQQALQPRSAMNAAGLDAVLVAVDHRWLKLDRPDLSGSPEECIAAAVERLRSVVQSLRQHGGAPAIVQTVPVPPQMLFGSFDRRVQGTVRAMIEEANRRIVDLAKETGSYLLDVAALAERIGADLWFDPVRWFSYKLPFASECDGIYADLLGRLVGAIRGRARKCLVLDLDNTIWGGVIGDDGLEGIRIGQGNALGEAFLSVQQLAMDLSQRGIVLAASSKNTDSIARQPFREHPDMLLRENHFAVFQANWTDKASNLEAIARHLNLGLDALVLLDDNPAERAQVRAALPMVGVPELPSDPSWYPWFLAAAGYFEAVAFSAEDRIRSQSYTSDASRAQVRATARNLEDYLSSLEMVMTVGPFDRQGRQRITQLINKTNQFNLTTRRYTESEVAALETDPSAWTLQVRLEDKFGELGMIAVLVCRQPGSDAVWEIDTWLMSCRVLGRRVEEAMLSVLLEAARERGIDRLIGTYIPTAKNDMVADHYAKLGFAETDGASAGARRFVLDVRGATVGSLPMEIARTGPGQARDTAPLRVEHPVVA